MRTARVPAVGLIALVAAVGVLVGSLPTTHLAPGESVTIDCAVPPNITPESALAITVSCPTPVPAPTASPSAPPTPSPTPTPTVTPSASPGTTVNVPATIDSTGASDVTQALLSFIASVPNGKTISFPPAGIYRIDTALKIGGRSNLTFAGNGATLRANGTGFNENYSLFYFQTFPGTNTGIRVTGFNLVGSSTTPGVFVSGKEGQHGVLADGGNGFEIDHNTFSALWGDAVEVNSGASNVHAHDNTVTNTGRNGLSVITGNHVEFDHNSLIRTGYMPYDVEPNTATQPSSFVDIHDNTSAYYSNAFFAIDGSGTGAALHDITVRNNKSVGKNLLTVVTGPGRKGAITFTGNTSDVGGGTASFLHVDGLSFYGDTQAGAPMSPSCTDCTGVITTPPAAGCYGSCINGDSKSNLQVGWTNRAKVAHRFRASTTSTITSIRFQQRGGAGYSGGTGGTIRVSLQAELNGIPSGTIIGTPGTYGPKVPAGGIFDLVPMGGTVVKGTLYDVVFENTDPNQTANYISVNELFVFGSPLVPRQPRFPDTDYAVLYADPTWHLEGQFTADMDITYADGTHDGMGYVQNMIDKYGTISGTQTVRERFTPTSSRTITGASVRIRRTSGADPLTIALRAGTTTVASGTVAAATIPATAPGGDNGGSVWVTVTYPAAVLNAGTTYDLVLSTSSTSVYTAAPIREGTDSGFAGSLGFPDGSGQQCAGSSCADLYPFSPVDIQFALR